MSEVLRTYSKPKGGGYRRARGPRGALGWIPLLLIAALLLWALWATRDTHPMAVLAPSGQAIEVFVADPQRNRERVAQSGVWDLLPPDAALRAAPDQLANHFGLPEWLLNNLVVGDCLVLGDDAAAFSDVLLIARMSRIGVLAERLHRLAPGITRDRAGGLWLRAVPDLGLYYAVRGRTMLLSRSRSALINALTLTPENRMGADRLAQGFSELAGDDILARIALPVNAPGGDYFDGMRVAMRFEPEALRVVAHGSLRSEVRAAWAPLLPGAPRGNLLLPPRGPLMLAVDLGWPLPDLLARVEGVFADETRDWGLTDWTRPDPEATTMGFPQFLGVLLDSTESAWGVAWLDLDPLEMLPMPGIAAVFETNAAGMRAVFENLPAPPAGTAPWESWPRLEAETGRVVLPAIGGPAIEPTAAIHGDALLVASSSAVADAAAEYEARPRRLDQPAHLYLRAEPAPIVEMLRSMGMDLAHIGMIRGHSPSSFEAMMDDWAHWAARVGVASAALSHEYGNLRLETRIVMDTNAVVTPAS